MKQLLLILLLLKVTVCVNAQTVTFNKSFIDYRSNSIISVLEADNGYIGTVSGRSNIVNGWFTLKIFQLDFNGNLEWLKLYGEEAKGYYPGFAGNLNRTHDGNYICAAMVQDTFGYYKGLLMKFDGNGDTLWTRSVGTSGKTEFYNSLVLADGSIMVVGSTNLITSTGAQDAYLLKFDSDGNLLWGRDYGGSGRDLFFQFAQTPDDGFICGGLTESYGKGQTDGYIVKTDSLGNMEWQKTFGTAGNDGATGVTLSSDGGYYIWGYYDSLISPSHFYAFPYIYKLDNNGNIVWKEYFPTFYPTYKTIKQVEEHNGYIYSSGSSADNNQELFGWFFKMSSTGFVEWERKYSYGTNDRSGWFEGYTRTSDSGFICVGSVSRNDTLPAFHQSMWAVKVDSNGCLYPTTACITGIDDALEKTVISIYPNPTNGHLTIALPQTGSAYGFTLTNLLGQQVYRATLHDTKTTLNLDIPPGLYIYRLTHPTLWRGQAQTGKLLVE